MTVDYCAEHTRVELEDGKCVACGEVEYKTKEQELMSDKTRIKWIVFVYGILFMIYAGYRFFSA